MSEKDDTLYFILLSIGEMENVESCVEKIDQMLLRFWDLFFCVKEFLLEFIFFSKFSRKEFLFLIGIIFKANHIYKIMMNTLNHYFYLRFMIPIKTKIRYFCPYQKASVSDFTEWRKLLKAQ